MQFFVCQKVWAYCSRTEIIGADFARDSFRFQKSVSKYGGITVNLYMKDVDSFRAVAHGLKEKDLFIDTMLEEKKYFRETLLQWHRKPVRNGR